MVKSKYFLQQSTLEFLPWILQAIDACRPILKAHGSGQWQGMEPSQETIKKDINHHHFWIFFEDLTPIGGVAILPSDAAYDHLISGAWLNPFPYRVLHRLFIHPQFHGRKLSYEFFQLIETNVWQQGINNIRLDTHEKNIPMRALLRRMNYQEVGQVILPHAGDRLVYHKVKEFK